MRAEWGARLSLPILYEAEDEIDFHRERWERGIKTLLDRLDLSTNIKVKEAAGAVNLHTNFYLHYQGRNDCRLQKFYGSLIHRIAATTYPEYSQPLSNCDIVGGRKIRVGFVSSFLQNHSVCRTFGRWITTLDKDRFIEDGQR